MKEVPDIDFQRGIRNLICLFRGTITSNKNGSILGLEFDAKNILVPKPKVSGDCLRA